MGCGQRQSPHHDAGGQLTKYLSRPADHPSSFPRGGPSSTRGGGGDPPRARCRGHGTGFCRHAALSLFALSSLGLATGGLPGGCGALRQRQHVVWGAGGSVGGILRLRGGMPIGSKVWRAMDNKQRWASAGFSLQPDFGPNANTEVPMEKKLGDAAECGDVEAVKALIAAGCSPDSPDPHGFMPLHRAAFHGHLDVVNVLCEAGANVNAQDQIGGRTPLHQAAGEGWKRICKKLIQHGADCKIKDLAYTPNVDAIAGMREAINEHPPIRLDAGPDKVWSYPGWTPYDYAVDQEYDSIAEELYPWTHEY